MVGREGDHLAAGAINADSRAHLEGMPLYAALELLVAVVRKPDRAAGEEHRRQRDIQRKRRVVFAAKAAADMGELSIDAGRLELVACLAEQVRDCRSGFVRRLGTQHEFEFLAAGVVPSE